LTKPAEFSHAQAAKLLFLIVKSSLSDAHLAAWPTRQTSATATPVSACLRANTICASVNLVFFMAIICLVETKINCPKLYFSMVHFIGGNQSALFFERDSSTSFIKKSRDTLDNFEQTNHLIYQRLPRINPWWLAFVGGYVRFDTASF
jgi:hypothetical protein